MKIATMPLILLMLTFPQISNAESLSGLLSNVFAPTRAISVFEGQVSVCSDCTTTTSLFFDKALSPILFPSRTCEQKKVYLLTGNPSSSETTALNYAMDIVADKGNWGAAYLQQTLTSHVSLRLFYELTLTDHCLSSLESEGVDSWQLERSYQHMHYAHYTSDGEPAIYVNVYQNRRHLSITLAHEIFHLFDRQTRAYSKKWQHKWGDLDSLALEFRAKIGEILLVSGVDDGDDWYNDIEFRETLNGLKNYINNDGTIDFKRVAHDLYSKHTSARRHLSISQPKRHMFAVSPFKLSLIQEESPEPKKAIYDFLFSSLQRNEFYKNVPEYRSLGAPIHTLSFQFKTVDILESSLENELRRRGRRTFWSYLKSQSMIGPSSVFVKPTTVLLNHMGKSGDEGDKPRDIGN